MACFWYPAYGQKRQPDVIYEPTPQEVVEAMLEMGRVTKEDVVYDLGCGDGRFVITAAKRFGARGVGVDIVPARIKESIENARKEGVAYQVTFIEKDLFETDISQATVVTLYLSQELNLRLRPKLFRELRPGARIISHTFDMDEWEPDNTGRIHLKTFYYWVMPADVRGLWSWSISLPNGKEHYILLLNQKFQKISGKVTIQRKKVSIADGQVKGDRVSFRVKHKTQRQTVLMQFSGHVTGDTIVGSVEVQGGPFAGNQEWLARRLP